MRRSTSPFLFKIVLGLTFFSILGLIIFFVIANTLIRSSLYESVLGVSEREKSLYAREIDTWFVAAEQTVYILSTVLSSLPSADYFEVIAESFVRDYDFIENVFIGFSNGSLINGVNWIPPEDWRTTERPWFTAAYEAGAGVITTTNPFWSNSTDTLTTAITIWLPNLQGIGAAIGFSISMDFVLERLSEHPVIDDGYLLLITSDGHILHHPNPRYTPNISEMFHIRDIPNGNLLMDLVESREIITAFDDYMLGETYLVTTPLEVVDWVLLAVIPADVALGDVYNTLIIIMVTLAGVSTGLLLVNVLFVAITTKAMERNRKVLETTQEYLDYAPYVVSVWNRDIKIIGVSKKAVELFGVRDEFHCLKVFNNLSPEFQPDGSKSEEKAVKLIKQAFEKDYMHFEWMHKTISGELIPTNITLVRLVRDNEPIVLAYITDTSQIVKESKRREKAEEESNAKTRFLARMSHEIRTPMNVILGLAEIELQKEFHSIETEEVFNRIRSSSLTLLDLINSILDLSQIEAGKIEILPKPYLTEELLIDTIQMALFYLKDKQIEFKLIPGKNLPLYMIGDGIRIKQILTNLLSNSFKYTSEGEVNLFVDVKNESTGLVLILKVVDTGQGMTSKQINMLFQSAFNRFNAEENYGVEGTGIGFNLLYNFIKLMDGDIKIESEKGKGTSITVFLPQKIRCKRVISEETYDSLKNMEFRSIKKMNLIKHVKMSHGKVLVVDDMESNLYVIRGYLQPYGLMVDTVYSGSEAINKIKSGKVYDIIFMDHMMPEMDGLEATKCLRELGYTAPIVALTANAVKGVKAMFLENGFTAFLSKPVNINKLDECLKEFIGNLEINETVAITAKNNLVKYALRDAKRVLLQIKNIVETGDDCDENMKIITISAHAMKSVMKSVEHHEFSNLAAELEQAGKENNKNIVFEKLPMFFKFLNDFITKFDISHEPKDELTNEENVAFLVVEFEKLKIACDSYNIGEMKKVLKIINEQILLKNTKGLIKEIELKILQGDYDDAAEIAGKYKKGI